MASFKQALLLVIAMAVLLVMSASAETVTTEATPKENSAAADAAVDAPVARAADDDQAEEADKEAAEPDEETDAHVVLDGASSRGYSHHHKRKYCRRKYYCRRYRVRSYRPCHHHYSHRLLEASGKVAAAAEPDAAAPLTAADNEADAGEDGVADTTASRGYRKYWYCYKKKCYWKTRCYRH